MAMGSQRFKKCGGTAVTTAISQLPGGVRAALGFRASDLIAGQANGVDGGSAMH
jgi:hypothetical protein